jgi:hypothetical protein
VKYVGYEIRVRTVETNRLTRSGLTRVSELCGDVVFVEPDGQEVRVWRLWEYKDANVLTEDLNNLRTRYERYHKRTKGRFKGEPPSSWYRAR